MIPILVVGAAGYALGKALEYLFSSEKQNEGLKPYFVYVRTPQFGKVTMRFTSYDGAYEVYEQIKKEGNVKYSVLLDFSEEEKKYYDSVQEEDRHDLDETDKVDEVTFGRGYELYAEKIF